MQYFSEDTNLSSLVMHLLLLNLDKLLIACRNNNYHGSL